MELKLASIRLQDRATFFDDFKDALPALNEGAAEELHRPEALELFDFQPVVQISSSEIRQFLHQLIDYLLRHRVEETGNDRRICFDQFVGCAFPVNRQAHLASHHFGEVMKAASATPDKYRAISAFFHHLIDPAGYSQSGLPEYVG